jgi:hypothetical protein
LHVELAADVERHALVQLGGDDVEDALLAGGGFAAGGVGDEGHRRGFVEQAQLAVGVLVVGGVREDAALE